MNWNYLQWYWQLSTSRTIYTLQNFKSNSDHKALATVVKGNERNKTYSSGLTRWVDRLIPFDFEINHAPV